MKNDSNDKKTEEKPLRNGCKNAQVTQNLGKKMYKAALMDGGGVGKAGGRWGRLVFRHFWCFPSNDESDQRKTGPMPQPVLPI